VGAASNALIAPLDFETKCAIWAGFRHWGLVENSLLYARWYRGRFRKCSRRLVMDYRDFIPDDDKEKRQKVANIEEEAEGTVF
jgi:hypothetical protein